MNFSPTARSVTEVWRTAFAAGRWAEARDLLEAAVKAGSADAMTWAHLADACRRLGDPAAAHAAADEALTRDITNLRGLMVKYELLLEAGAEREAGVYGRGLIQHGGEGRGLPDDLAVAVRRAHDRQQALREALLAGLAERLAEAGYVEGRTNPRFTHALDLATGRRQLYLQQPKGLYYPELAPIQFFPRELFPWLERVEAATADMTAELSSLLEQDAGFEPYLTTQPGLLNTDYPLIDSMDWSSAFLWKEGQETALAARCPKTMAALRDVPLCRVRGRSPYVMFSQLKPGAHIRPHTGGVNTRLVCHVPLIVPPGCRFRVGNETREWQVGKAWVFDDTIEHEAINTGDRTRVVLIFDIWRPELTEEERRLIATWLETVDEFSPVPTVWD